MRDSKVLGSRNFSAIGFEAAGGDAHFNVEDLRSDLLQFLPTLFNGKPCSRRPVGAFQHNDAVSKKPAIWFTGVRVAEVISNIAVPAVPVHTRQARRLHYEASF